jgi:hypothetical protein
VVARQARFGVRFNEPIRATELLVQMSHSRTWQPRRTAGQPRAQLSGCGPDLRLSDPVSIQVSSGRTGNTQPMPGHG